MALAAPTVALFKWTVNVARELIRLRRDNHNDFEGFIASPSQCRRKWYSLKYGTDIDLVFAEIVDPILMVVLRIVDLILAIIIHGIVNHIFTIIQGIIDPIPEDTKGGHILHEGEVFR
ncbi:4103_t:CDS:2 [Funneliformis geosporum]|nr:4103_t:CDS:2 [Funneliformis geosporum]